MKEAFIAGLFWRVSVQASAIFRLPVLTAHCVRLCSEKLCVNNYLSVIPQIAQQSCDRKAIFEWPVHKRTSGFSVHLVVFEITFCWSFSLSCCS